MSGGVWLWSALAHASLWDEVEARRVDAQAFVPPGPLERARFAAWLTELTQAATMGVVPPDLDQRAQDLGWLVLRQDQALWLVEQVPQGRGVVGLSLAAEAPPVVLEAPHPWFDRGTAELCATLFEAGHARAVVLATTHRSVADPAHEVGLMFQAATIALSRAQLAPWVVQLHGFGADTSTADAVVSSGAGRRGAQDIPTVASELARALGLDSVATGDSVPVLAARTNVQSQAVGDEARFVHLELSPEVRDRLARDPSPMAAFLDSLQGAPALGAWEPPLRHRGEPVAVGAGRAVLLRPSDGAPPQGTADDGSWAFQATSEGYLWPPAATERQLTVDASTEVRPWSSRERVVVWDALERGRDDQQRLAWLADAPLDPALFSTLDTATIDLPPELPWTLHVRGPGLVVLDTSPRTERPLERYALETSLDGAPPVSTPHAASAQASVRAMRVVPAGAHDLTIVVRGSTLVGIEVQELLRRPRLVEAFRKPTPPGPALRTADDASSPRALPRDARSLEAQRLDATGGPRPLGTAWLEQAARPFAGDGPPLLQEALREQALATRFTALVSDSPSERVVINDLGPGVPRVRVEPGAPAEVMLSVPRDPALVPVLRLRLSDGPGRWLLDGQPWASGPGDLRLGLSPGAHTLEVLDGRVDLLDAELVSRGGRRTYEWSLVSLPATWTLPAPGVPAELRALTEPHADLLAETSDGVVELVQADARGALALRVGSHAQWVRFSAVDPEEVHTLGLAMRVLRALEPGHPDAPAGSAGEASTSDAANDLLDRVRRASVAIDQGHDEARLDRALAWLDLGRLRWARADLSWLWDDRGLREAAERALAQRPESAPSGPRLGPLDPPSAWAEGRTEVPTTGPSVVGLAERGQWLAAGELAHQQGDPLEAARLFLRAGETGATSLEELLAAVRWESLDRPEGGAGLSKVRVMPASPAPSTYRQARDALVAAPFQARPLEAGWFETLRLDSAAASLDLYCRDLTLAQRPCEVPLRLGADRAGATLPPGVTVIVTVPSGTGSLDVGPVAEGFVLVWRLRRDDRVLEPEVERTALHATPARPLEFVVMAGSLVRVSTLEGSGQAILDGDPASALSAGRATVLVVPPGRPRRLRLEGELAALVAVGTFLPEDLPGPTPVLEPSWWSAPTPTAWTDEVLRAAADTPAARGVLVGRGGTARAAWVARRELQSWSGSSMEALGLDLGWSSRREPWLTDLSAWGAGPGLAAGAAAWGGVAGPRAYGAVGGEVAAQGDAGHAQLRLRARVDLWRRPAGALRDEWLLRSGSVWGAPTSMVDPRAWTADLAHDPTQAENRLSWTAAPWRDTSLRWTLLARSNDEPTLDRVGLQWAARSTPAAAWLLGVDTELDRLFTDEDRSAAVWRWRAGPGASWRFAGTRSQRWTLELKTTWMTGQALPRAALALGWQGSRERGLRDAPPWTEPFRALREPVPEGVTP